MMQTVWWVRFLMMAVGGLCLIGLSSCMPNDHDLSAEEKQGGPPWKLQLMMRFDEQGGLLQPVRAVKPGQPAEDMPRWNGQPPPADALKAVIYTTHSSPGCVYVNHGGTWYKICY